MPTMQVLLGTFLFTHGRLAGQKPIPCILPRAPPYCNFLFPTGNWYVYGHAFLPPFMRWPPVQLCTYVCMYICTPLCTMYCIQPLVHTLKFLQLYSDFASASTSCPTGKEASTVCELSALEVAWQAFQRTYAMGKQTMLILMYIDIN